MKHEKRICVLACELTFLEDHKKAEKTALKEYREKNECENPAEESHGHSPHCFSQGVEVEDACGVCKKANEIWERYTKRTRQAANIRAKLRKLCRETINYHTLK